MSITQLKFLSRDMLYYGTGNMLYTIAQLISMPIIIRSMSMHEVANWNLLLPTGVLLSAIVTFGMDSAVVRFVIDQSELRKKIVFSSSLYFVVGLAAIVSISFWVFAKHVTNIINFSSVYLTSYRIMLYWLPGVILSKFFQNWMKYTFQRYRFIKLIGLQSAIYLIVVLCLKLTHRINLQNVMLASLLSIWTTALLGLFYSRNMLVSKIDKKNLGEMLRYGAPFMVMAFGFNLMFSIDKYILSGNISHAQFAIYSQAFRIAAIFSIIVSSFNFAFGPLSLSLLNRGDAPQIFSYLRTYYLLFMCLLGMVFMAMSKIIILLLSGQNYVEGNKFFLFFIAGHIFYGLFSFGQLGMIRSKKSYLGLHALAIGLIVTIGLDVVLFQRLQGYGTAIGFSIGTLVMAFMAHCLSRKYLTIGGNHLKDGVIVLVFIISGALSLLLKTTPNLYADGVVKITIGALCFYIIIMLPLFKSERHLFKSVLSKVVLILKSNRFVSGFGVTND